MSIKCFCDICSEEISDHQRPLEPQYQYVGCCPEMKRTVLNRKRQCPKSKLAAIKRQRFPLVMIEWLDSCDIAGWKRLDAWNGVHTLQCVSVGFLIGEDAQSKTVSPHLAYPDDVTNTSGSGIMIIPARAITRLTVLATGYRDG